MFGLGLQMKAPVESIMIRFEEAEKSCDRVAKASGSKEPAREVSWGIKSIRRHLTSVRNESRIIDAELRRWRRGRLSTVESLIEYTRMLGGSILALDCKLHPRLRGSLVDRARKDLSATLNAVTRLLVWTKRQKSRLDGRHGRFEHIFRMALSVDARVTRRVSRESLARWLTAYDAPEWEEDFELLRLAKLFVAWSHPLQEWALCWRSDAPGRPLRSMPVESFFLTDDQLRDLERHIGRHDEFFIAALRPRWRIVCSSSWQWGRIP